MTACAKFRATIYNLLLYLWDGLGFFGTDHMKLGRLKGDKVDFCTFFKSPQTILLWFVAMVVSIYIIVNEGSNLGLQKAQTVSLVLSDYYSYDFKDVLTLHAANWFWQSEIWDHIRKAQLQHLQETDAKKKDQMRTYPTLREGISYDDLTWHDRRFVEEYLCNRTNVNFLIENFFDAIGIPTYTDTYRYKMRCELMLIVNDKIRVHYWIPVHEPGYQA